MTEKIDAETESATEETLQETSGTHETEELTTDDQTHEGKSIWFTTKMQVFRLSLESS